MEYINYQYVTETNRRDVSGFIGEALIKLQNAQRMYPDLIMDVVNSGNLSRQIDLTLVEKQGNSRIDGTPLSSSAGAYFFNEEVLGGTREKQVIRYINSLGGMICDWQSQQTKLKLGPGIGLIEAPPLYRKLAYMGVKNPNLTVNYSGPSGTAEAKRGIKTIMDSRIDPEGDFFPEDGVFVTEGATEGIDLFMEALATLAPQSRVVFLGLSYYTGPYSAAQKGLKVDRLVTNPVEINGNTRFFPSAQEIEKSLPIDTKALVITIPNNPNGETYKDQDLAEIIGMAKEKGIYILFDGIFENMYFDDEENYRSRILQIAAEQGALEKVVVVDSLSKTRNFAGKRLGFLASADREMVDTITNIVLSRRCNPPFTVGPLLSFEGLARKVKALRKNTPNIPLERIVEYAFGEEDYAFSKNSFITMFQEWNAWDTQVLEYYKGNLQIVKALLANSSSGWSPAEPAFNTFVRSAKPGSDINSMDFLAKLMFTLGTYTQVGPCFGISQKTWDNELGIWTRISYACSRRDLIEALTRLVIFTQFYQEKNFGDPNKFPVLQMRFDKQI